MMAQLRCHFKRQHTELLTSRLYNEQTFYRAFVQDLACSEQEVVIESPFLTTRRIASLMPKLKQALGRGVKVVVNTRHPQEHDDFMRIEAEKSIAIMQSVGIKVLYTGGHHRKLAIFDRKVLYEGSLNILSQGDSCELMRRIESNRLAQQMLEFTKVKMFL